MTGKRNVLEKNAWNVSRNRKLEIATFVPTVFDRLTSVIDLKDPSLRGEGGSRVVILHTKGENGHVWVSDVRIR